VIVTRSASDYPTTVARLTEAIDKRGLTVFARIDHAGAARAAGLELADEEVVVFGNARAGTPLMQSDPRVGIELPLRILIWAGPDGVQLGYEDPRDLAERYELDGQLATLDAMAVLLADLAAEAAG
jgi:uncharacterized protein (DUF302 family)